MRPSSVGFLILLVLGLLMTPLAVDAQPESRVYRIGILWPGTAASVGAFMPTFREALYEHGFFEGRNLVLEQRLAEGNYARLADLATELVRLKVDVLVARSTLAARAALQATQTIPIVMTSGDPIGTDVVAGLARPGGNVTGLTFFSLDLVGKRLELLRELVPGLTRVAVLWDLDGPSKILEFKEAERRAPTLGMQLQSWGVRAPRPDLGEVFQTMVKGPVGAVLILGNPLTFSHREQIVALAAQHRLPAMFDTRDSVATGGLISYGPNQADYNRRIAYYVSRILKGAKPADLPVEQPTKFELVINLKTAKALGLTIPQTLLLRADQVIDP